MATRQAVVKKHVLTNGDYKRAMNNQSAVNASGVARDLVDTFEKVWAEARANGLGTNYVNNHPAVRLMVEQLLHLCCALDYHDAYEIVLARSAEDWPPEQLKA